MRILLDVGGTEIKAAVLDDAGCFLTEIVHFPAKARKKREEILLNFGFVIKALLEMGKESLAKAERQEETVKSVRMAFPGPFDYENGICLMQGLDKYDAIYGVSLEEEIKVRVPEVNRSEFLFCHDIEAFALGTALLDELSGCNIVFCLCIGTGAGSAFTKQGKILKKEEGLPESGWIYHLPFRESVIDDYLSVRGLEKITSGVFGGNYGEVPNMKEGVRADDKTAAAAAIPNGAMLFGMAQRGDQKALAVWSLFGETVREALFPILERVKPDVLVLGGQIAKSFCYFGGPTQDCCSRLGIRIHLEYDTSIRTIQGLDRLNETGNCETSGSLN